MFFEYIVLFFRLTNIYEDFKVTKKKHIYVNISYQATKLLHLSYKFLALAMIEKIILNVFLLFIKIYQKLVSPFIPPACRFVPTCSVYTEQAFLKYGLFKGLFLSFKRIITCHPWNKGGFDPVP